METTTTTTLTVTIPYQTFQTMVVENHNLKNEVNDLKSELSKAKWKLMHLGKRIKKVTSRELFLIIFSL
jgi:hypothetical protein